MQRLARWAFVMVVGAMTMTAGAAVAWAQVARLWSAGTATTDEVALRPLDERSLVLASDGSVLAVLHAEQNRRLVGLDQIPGEVVDVVLAIEDEHFFVHGGVNLVSTVRALRSNVEGGGVLQGGSTITQQVVKNAVLSPEKSLSRKLREAVLAWRLEAEQSKEKILERYLNTVYFGNGAYGLQAAAEVYWGIDAGDLTVAEAALLAAVIRNPVGYDPIRFPAVARERRQLVVGRLAALGLIDEPTAAKISASPLPTARRLVNPSPDDHFIEAVKQTLLDDERLGETVVDRINAVFRGGLVIHTTLDPGVQAAAEAAVADQLPDTDGDFTAAVVSVEVGTGAVRALVGGPGFERSKFNLATQARRQPGSSFKPFVLATAIRQGLSPKDRINGVGPCRFDLDELPEPWKVQNFGNSRGRTYTLADATKYSSNCAYARLIQHVRPESVVELAHELGVAGDVEPVLAMALGTEEVTPLEMAGAYATFAADGVFSAPYLVESVVDRNGVTILEGRPDPVRVLEVNEARLVVDTLVEVVRGGTGTAARLASHEAMGKTGTSQEFANAWFVGATHDLATAVWMGSPVGNVAMYISGVRVTGGSFPARIWRAMMTAALDGVDSDPFPEPDWSQVTTSRSILRLPGERIWWPRATTTTPAEETSSTTIKKKASTTTTTTGEAPTTTSTTAAASPSSTTTSPPPATAPATTSTSGG